MTPQPTIAFIGAGNMASAIISGLIRQGSDANHIIAADPCVHDKPFLTHTLGVRCLTDNQHAANQADIIVLAVKPQQMQTVCEAIDLGIRRPLILSIAAGITTQAIQQWLKTENLAVVRAMPNTPAMIGAGASGLFANASVTPEQKNQAEHLLRACGITLWVTQECDLNAVTAISGSGPAYGFYLLEAMQQAGEQLGLSAADSQLLSIQTLLGAAKLALESEQTAAELREMVTSPNGTTHAAIRHFDATNVKQALKDGMIAAKRRADELAGFDFAQPNDSAQLTDSPV